MKNLLYIFHFILLFGLQVSSTFAADTVHCNGNCDLKCDDIEKISLGIMDNDSENLLKKFQLKSDPKVSGKQFMDSISESLNVLVDSRKSVTEQCLDSYCGKSEKKQKKTEIAKGLYLSYTNPVCDYSPSQRNSQVTMLMVMLSTDQGTISQMSYTKRDSDLLVMLKVPTKKCTDNEGGSFDNKIITSLRSIVIVPDEGTTQVKNTPVGGQLVKTKKSVPKMQIGANGILKFDLGENYNVEINPQTKVMVSDNILVPNCKGNIIRNPSKGSSRLGIAFPSIINKGSKVYDSNNYKVIDAEKAKVNW